MCKTGSDFYRHKCSVLLIYCVSSISIALEYTPGASGNHSESEECTKATPPPIAEGADR